MQGGLEGKASLYNWQPVWPVVVKNEHDRVVFWKTLFSVLHRITDPSVFWGHDFYTQWQANTISHHVATPDCFILKCFFFSRYRNVSCYDVISMATFQGCRARILAACWYSVIHCTLFVLVCFANKNENCQLSYSWFQISQTGGEQYSDTPPFSVPSLTYSLFSGWISLDFCGVTDSSKCSSLLWYSDNYGSKNIYRWAQEKTNRLLIVISVQCD